MVASFKIFPADIDVKLDLIREAIRNKLPKEASVYTFEEEPIAFGLIALIAHIIFPEDIEGEMDRIENILSQLEYVGETQVLMVRRV